MKLDALYEQFLLSKKHKIKIFGELLHKIREEIGKRDLTQIPTDKLFDILLKLTTSFKKEEIGLMFKKEIPSELKLTEEKTWSV